MRNTRARYVLLSPALSCEESISVCLEIDKAVQNFFTRPLFFCRIARLMSFFVSSDIVFGVFRETLTVGLNMSPLFLYVFPPS